MRRHTRRALQEPVPEGQVRRSRSTQRQANSRSLTPIRRSKQLFLVVCLENTPVQMKAIVSKIGAKKRLAFASKEVLQEVLGVTPGAVTPFAVINDTNQRVTVILEERMLTDHDTLCFHPLMVRVARSQLLRPLKQPQNSATTQISPDDLQRFLESCGNAVRVVDLSSQPSGK